MKNFNIWMICLKLNRFFYSLIIQFGYFSIFRSMLIDLDPLQTYRLI